MAVISRKRLWLNHNIRSWSTIISIPFLSCVFLLISTIFIECMSQMFQIFFVFHLIILFETNSSWLIYESIKTLESLTLIISNVSFPGNTMLSCFFFSFLIIYLYFLIPKVVTKIFIPTAELEILTGTQPNEANEEVETLIMEAKISMSLI